MYKMPRFNDLRADKVNHSSFAVYKKNYLQQVERVEAHKGVGLDALDLVRVDQPEYKYYWDMQYQIIVLLVSH